MRRLAAAVLVAGVLAAGGAVLLVDDDDVPVPMDTPGARRAVTEALEVVPGRVVEVTRDRDNGKWEVIVDQDGGRYEIELDPATFGLLRLDYD
jgi:hypothetical protein